jgi:hypothetical protein
MAKYYYQRTHKVVDIPDDLTDEYDGRRWYQRLDAPKHQPPGQDWEPAEVPDGTVAEVLEWVGDDDLRRQSALTVERAGKQRTTLLAALAES